MLYINTYLFIRDLVHDCHSMNDIASVKVEDVMYSITPAKYTYFHENIHLALPYG
jgi:hypothetical protein